MSIEGTISGIDLLDSPDSKLGNVGIISSKQDEYLPLLLNELRRASLVLRAIVESTGIRPTVSTILGSNVTLTSTNTFFDAVSVVCVPGTWLLQGIVAIQSTFATEITLTIQLWDGVTTLVSSEAHSTIQTISVPVAALVSPVQTTTYKISVATNNTGTVTINTATTKLPSGNNATNLVAIRLA